MYNQYNPWGVNMNAGMGINPGRISRIPKVNWNNVLNNTQRTLGIINQAIPLIYQVRPLVNNARTIFKIAGAINEENKESHTSYEQTQSTNANQSFENNSNLQFFL